jgi:predicted AlkP superfamily pyrophosphatase or phosphodiesterase
MTLSVPFRTLRSATLQASMTPVTFVLALALGGVAMAARPAFADPPKLVVFLAIDQMRGDYIDRYGVQWTRGLRRLVDEGALFPQAAYPYFTTVTCAGHATMGTGTFPMTHGQIQNAWFDRDTGKDVSCTDDLSVTQISYGTQDKGPSIGGNSGARMLAPSFADELRSQATRPPRIVSISMKPRSAIGLVGHAGDVVMWYDTGKGWATSTAFATGKNPLVEKFLEANPMTRELGTPWTKLLPESAYFYEDDGLKENPPKGWTTVFPHPLTIPAGAPPDDDAYTRWEDSPFADTYLERMALALVDGLKLGQSPGTDYLAIGFSALDHTGHPFGPRSHEVQDTLARLDRTIGDLLTALDAKVGRGNYVVALSADHGVSPIPEQMAKLHFDAGRIDGLALTTKVTQVLAARLGTGKMLEKITNPYVYLAPGVYDKLKAKPDAMQAVIDAITTTPGIARVLTREQLEKGVETDDAIIRAARLSYYAPRSGELLIVPKPYWQGGTGGATHGTPYLYDQRVPVLLFGAGVKPGKYWQAASPADIAPTLAALCGITMSRSDGHVLAEAIVPTSTKAARPAARTGASAATGARH